MLPRPQPQRLQMPQRLRTSRRFRTRRLRMPGCSSPRPGHSEQIPKVPNDPAPDFPDGFPASVFQIPQRLRTSRRFQTRRLRMPECSSPSLGHSEQIPNTPDDPAPDFPDGSGSQSFRFRTSRAVRPLVRPPRQPRVSTPASDRKRYLFRGAVFACVRRASAPVWNHHPCPAVSGRILPGRLRRICLPDCLSETGRSRLDRKSLSSHPVRALSSSGRSYLVRLFPSGMRYLPDTSRKPQAGYLSWAGYLFCGGSLHRFPTTPNSSGVFIVRFPDSLFVPISVSVFV